MLLSPGLLILFGLLNWGFRAAVNRIPSPERTTVTTPAATTRGDATTGGDEPKEEAT